VLPNEQWVEPAMRIATKLAIVLITIALCAKLSAQQTAVIINLTEQGNFGLVSESYGRIVNPNATPGSYVPPGCHYMPAPMPYFMEFRKYVGMHAGYLPRFTESRR
jgi:hypothetical protein